jgi:hypothetical protein
MDRYGHRQLQSFRRFPNDPFSLAHREIPVYGVLQGGDGATVVVIADSSFKGDDSTDLGMLGDDLL